MYQETYLLFLAVIVIAVSVAAWIWADEVKLTRSVNPLGQDSENTFEKLKPIIKLWSLSLILLISVSTGLLPRSILEDFFKNCGEAVGVFPPSGQPSGLWNSQKQDKSISTSSVQISMTTIGSLTSGGQYAEKSANHIYTPELESKKSELAGMALLRTVQNMQQNSIKS